MRTQRPLVERVALFWHGHVATHEGKLRDHRKLLTQIELFQRANFERDLMSPDFMGVSNERYLAITMGAEMRAMHGPITRGLDVAVATMPV